MDNIGKYELSKFYEMLGRIANGVEATAHTLNKLTEHIEKQVEQTDRIENLIVLLTSLKAADQHMSISHTGSDALGYEVEHMTADEIRALAVEHFHKTNIYDDAQLTAKHDARMQAAYGSDESSETAQQ